ncbi:glycosyltransferase family 4 protein [Fibrella sp. ES10-3-2-2]|nr:hypothetical protein A6C57_14115 [Fibrella sp. ES10-3-2-2]
MSDQSIPLLIINSHPIQYFAPLYRHLAADPAFSVTVLYGSRHGLSGETDKQFGQAVQWNIPLLDGYTHKFLSNQSPSPSIYGFWGLLNLSVLLHIWRAPRKSIVIVHGWAYALCWIAISFARLSGHTVCLRGESPQKLEQRKSGWRQQLRKRLLSRGLFPLINYFLYIGQQNRLFYQGMGVKSAKLLFCPYAVDNDRFQHYVASLATSKSDIRTRLKLPADGLVILSAGKYIAKKRPMDLLRAFASLHRPNITLVLVGDGHLRAELTQYIHEQALQSVYLTGFINQAEIGAYYAAADLYVMCSTEEETWGLSTNEAMNFRLPLVLSDAIGCAADLVREGINGYSYPCGDIEQLTDRLSRILAMTAAERQQMGDASLALINQYSYHQTGESLKSAFRTLS